MNENSISGNKSHLQIKLLNNRDADKCTATLFMVLSTPDFETHDWILNDKFVEMGGMLQESIDDEFEYPVKTATMAAEGRKAKEGKAVRITFDNDILSIGIYTQTYGKLWELSHTHLVDKSVFNNYVSVAKNDADVIKRELTNARETRRSFTLNLD